MVDWELLRNIAVAITIIGTTLTLLITLLKKIVLPRIKEYIEETQNPREKVTKEMLSWKDIGEGIINILLPKAKTFHPHAIFGINLEGLSLARSLQKS